MKGYVHTIMGPMFSGKTSFLLHELERFARAGRKVVLFTADSRADNPVVHSQRPLYKGISVVKSRDADRIWAESRAFDVVGVDEVQFYEPAVVQVLSRLALEGRIVLASGLDQDFRAEPFMTTLRLVTESEKLTRLTSVCQNCGSLLAIRNYRKVDSDERILEGADEVYEARCRNCMSMGPRLPV